MTLWHADEPPGMAVSGPGLVGTVYEGGMGVGAARSVFATVTWLHVPSVVRSCPAGRWEGLVVIHRTVFGLFRCRALLGVCPRRALVSWTPGPRV